MGHQYATLEDTLYFYFAANDTSGSGDDGATPLADVRLGGAAAGAIPTLSPTPTLLSHANFPAGCYEVAVAATAANGFAADNTYGVFCTLAVDSQNPTGFIGSFRLGLNTPIDGNLTGNLVGNVTGDVNGIVDVGAISGDSTAANNLELQYDGTGLAGGTFPATQDQISSITNAGAAVNTTVDSYTLTTGTQSSGTVTSTEALDGTNHEHTDTAGAMDLYYEFLIGSGSPSSVKFDGYLNNNNDDLEVHGYDWVAAGWVQIGTLEGKNASTNETNSYDLTTAMVGTGADLGKVRVRFTDGAFTLTTATLAVDRILVAFNQAAGGYTDGIEVDTNGSNTNTVPGVDGVKGNPVSTWAAALTLSASTGINQFHIINGSSITLTANSDNYTLTGVGWTLALGGQSIGGAHFAGADVTGTGTGSEPNFTNCHFGSGGVTLPPAQLDSCGLEGTFTVGSAGTFFFDNCHSGVAGTSTPIFDFGSLLNSSDVNFRRYSGGIEIQNMGAGTGSYNMSLEGFGALIINANCSATSLVAMRGHFDVTDNAGGAVTLSQDPNFISSELVDAVWDELLTGATHNTATSAGKMLRQLSEGGFEGGAIWIDTVGGSPTGEGWLSDPVDDIGAALTIAAATGRRTFRYLMGSSDTLTAAVDGYCIHGWGFTLALGGQSISNTRIHNGTLTGNATGAVPPEFRKCTFGTTALPNMTLPPCTIRQGLYAGKITAAAAGDFFLISGASAVAGVATWTFDFGAAIGTTNLNVRRHSGGVEIENMGQAGTDTMSLEGDGQIIANANCAGGTVAIRGNFTKTDNSGNITFSEDARIDVGQIQTAANAALVVQRLDHLVAVADSDDPVDNSIIAKLAAASGDWSNFDPSTDALEALQIDHVALASGLTTIIADVTGINGDAMRGTDSAALASVVGALADAAAAGDPTSADTLMQYAKQLINTLEGSAGIPVFPAEAAPANNVSMAEVLRAVHADTNALAAGTALSALGVETIKRGLPHVVHLAPSATDTVTLRGPDLELTKTAPTLVQEGSTGRYTAVFTPDEYGPWLLTIQDGTGTLVAERHFNCLGATDTEHTLGIQNSHQSTVPIWPAEVAAGTWPGYMTSASNDNRSFINTGKFVIPWTGYVYGVKLYSNSTMVNLDSLRFFTGSGTKTSVTVRGVSEDFHANTPDEGSFTGETWHTFTFDKPVWAVSGDFFGLEFDYGAGSPSGAAAILRDAVNAGSTAAVELYVMNSLLNLAAANTFATWVSTQQIIGIQPIMAPPAIAVTGHSFWASHPDSGTVFENDDIEYDRTEDFAAMIEDRLGGISVVNCAHGGSDAASWVNASGHFEDIVDDLHPAVMLFDTVYNDTDQTVASMLGWMDRLLGLCDQQSTELIVLESPGSDTANTAGLADEIEAHNQAISAWCDQHGVCFVPLEFRLGAHSGGTEHASFRRIYQDLTNLPDYGAEATPIHPSTAGRQAAAQAVVNALRNRRGVGTRRYERRTIETSVMPTNAATLGADGAITVNTITSTVGPGEVSEGPFSNPQYARFGPHTFTIVDADNTPISQAGDSHTFIVYDPDTKGVVLWSLNTANGEISVGGANDNVLTVTDDDTNTGTDGVFRYCIRNDTDDTLVARGPLTIEADEDTP